MARRGVGPVHRARQARRLLRSEGLPGISHRLRVRAADRLVPPGSGGIGLMPHEVELAADAVAAGGPPGPLALSPGEPMRVAWVCNPPAGGSGGHTTLFRMVAAVERAGHRCTVHVRDPSGWSIEQHRAVVRRHWPEVAADVLALADGIDDAHAVVATGWESAYSVLGSPARGRRFYLVQDLEPLFTAAGSESLLAEATYDFGFHGLTAGSWLASRLRRDHAMSADSFDFGCDRTSYWLDVEQQAPRDGVAYFCRPATPRRAHELAVAALERFARHRPDVPVHVFGETVGDLPFPAVQHGLLSPDELGRLYNRCVAGLVLSATNVSLVPWEMLASGCVPVVNDADHNREVLGGAGVRYAAATPWALAEALTGLVDSDHPGDHAAAGERAVTAAASVRDVSWDEAGRTVEAAIRRVVLDHDLRASA